ncbi:hypothetical protein ACFTSD_02620 [Nocardiaceae bacterium NPDC056970]
MTEPTTYERLILAGLQLQTHIYAGTVSYAEKRRRRAKAKAARIARRVNR